MINLLRELQREIAGVSTKCYACSKCVSGCPVASDMDFKPSQLIREIALGNVDNLLISKTLWICSSCQTCLSRCPFQINIPHIIDLLKEYAYKNKLAGKEKSIRLFHKVFLSNIKRCGRIHELKFIGEWKVLSGKLFDDVFLGMRMFFRGKLTISGEKVTGKKEIKKLFSSHLKSGNYTDKHK